MKQIHALFLISLLFSSPLFPQNLNQLGVDDRDGSLMLLGECNRDGKEAGRITETPMESLEKDLAGILAGK